MNSQSVLRDMLKLDMIIRSSNKNPLCYICSSFVINPMSPSDGILIERKFLFLRRGILTKTDHHPTISIFQRTPKEKTDKHKDRNGAGADAHLGMRPSGWMPCSRQ
jgi:hypothetical protein